MIIDRTRPRATKRTEVMERIRDRIILEHKDLLILVIHLENWGLNKIGSLFSSFLGLAYLVEMSNFMAYLCTLHSWLDTSVPAGVPVFHISCNLLSHGATFRMGVLLPNYPEENVVKGDNVPNFSKMNGGKTRNGTSHGMQNSISYVNTTNGTANSTPDSTSNVFQILNDIWKRQRAVQCQYDSSTIPTVPKTETPFRTTTLSTPATTATTAKQLDSSTLCTCPQAAETGSQTRRLVSLEKSPAPAQWKDFCEQTH